MYIIKASGKKEKRDISKIQKQTSCAVRGLSGVDQSDLELEVSQYVVDGTSSKEIQQHLIRCAIEKTSKLQPNWTYVAARLYMYDMYKRICKFGISYEEGIEKWCKLATSHSKMYVGLLDGYNVAQLDAVICKDNDMKFTYLGIKTLYDRYAIKINGEHVELPQYLLMGVALFLHSNETENKTDKAIKYYKMLSDKLAMNGTPTLSNARTPRHQLSSCFIGATHDSAEGLTEANSAMALISKLGGGIGWDYSLVRASLSKIDGHAGAAGGPVPFLKVTNDISLAYDQLGTRAGAIAVYMEPWHLNIIDFLDLKKNSGEERRRAHDLFPALWVNDLFMQRVEEDGDWYLFDPYDVKLNGVFGDDFEERYLDYCSDDSVRKEKVSAKTLWKQILKSYFETGSPFLTFKDTTNRQNSNGHAGMIRSSNLCTEIFQNTHPGKIVQEILFTNGEVRTYNELDLVGTSNGLKYAKRITSLDIIDDEQVYFNGKKIVDREIAVCNLGSLNLGNPDALVKLQDTIETLVRGLDNVVDLNLYPLIEAQRTARGTRAIGLGIMGEAEMLARHKIMWGTPDHYKLINDVMEQISFYTIEASINLAEEKGVYPQYEGSTWSKGIFPHELSKTHEDVPTFPLTMDWEGLRRRLKRHGIRNGYLLAIAPTSSISILCGTTPTIEPVYKLHFFEDNLSGLIPVVAPGLTAENEKFYPTSYSLDQSILVTAAAVRQKWIDQGQSLNIFVDQAKASGKYLNDIYMKVWKYGLMSSYYLRSESPDVEAANVHEDITCFGCQ